MSTIDQARPLPPTAVLLPREEWVAERIFGDRIAVAMHTNFGGLYWRVFNASDLPNDDLINADDLERAFANWVEPSTVG